MGRLWWKIEMTHCQETSLMPCLIAKAGILCAMFAFPPAKWGSLCATFASPPTKLGILCDGRCYSSRRNFFETAVFLCFEGGTDLCSFTKGGDRLVFPAHSTSQLCRRPQSR